MSKPQVEIRIVREEDGWSGFRHRADVYVDGEFVTGGSYGGEPEDNTRWRDYKWVEESLRQLALSLGAAAEITETDERSAESVED